MLTPYEFDPETGVVKVCAYCPNKEALDARAALEYPRAMRSHGMCPDCYERIKIELMEPRAGWLAPVEAPIRIKPEVKL